MVARAKLIIATEMGATVHKKPMIEGMIDNASLWHLN